MVDIERDKIIDNIKEILCQSEIQKIKCDESLFLDGIIDEPLSLIELDENNNLLINGYFLQNEIEDNDLENILSFLKP